MSVLDELLQYVESLESFGENQAPVQIPLRVESKSKGKAKKRQFAPEVVKQFLEKAGINVKDVSKPAAFRLLDEAEKRLLDPERTDREDPLPAAIMADAFGNEIAAASGTAAPAQVSPIALRARPRTAEDILLALTGLGTQQVAALSNLIRPPIQQQGVDVRKTQESRIDRQSKLARLDALRVKKRANAEKAAKAFSNRELNESPIFKNMSDAEKQRQAPILFERYMKSRGF